MQWVSNRNTLLCLLLLSWVINYCALVSFNPCPDEKRNVQPSFSPRLMFRLAPSFEGFVASLKNLQYNFPKMRGGGSKAVWNFSENSSILEGEGVPKSIYRQFWKITISISENIDIAQKVFRIYRYC